MHGQIARPLRQPRRSGSAVGLGARCTRLLCSRSFHFRQRRIAGKRRRVAHRRRQHVAHGIAKRGDIGPRARKSWRTALCRASTEHAE